MERRAEPAGRRRLYPIAAVALVGVVAALSLGSLFLGASPKLELLAAVGICSGIALTLDRRRLVIVLAAAAVGLILFLGIVLFRGTTWHGVPTTETFRAMIDATRLTSAQAREQIAPTPPLAPLVLPAIVAVWAATLASYVLAVRAGSPLLAAAAPIALFAFSGVVLKSSPGPAASAVMLAGVIMLLFADGLRRVLDWGPIRALSTGSAKRAGRLPASRGARRVGAAAVTAALVLPALAPVFRPPGTQLDLAVPSGSRVNPLVSIQASLQQNPSVELFDVTSSRPAYWRMVTLDHFDGSNWSALDLSATGGEPVLAGDSQALAPSDGLLPATSPLLHQQIHIVGLRTPWMPMAASPQRLLLQDSSALFAPELGYAALPTALPGGFDYEVDSWLPQPTPEELDMSDPASAGPVLSEPVFRKYTALPPDTPRELVALARHVTAGQPDAYRKVIALQDFLRSNFAYDEHVRTPAGANALLYFLENSRRGFCQQFAGAMAAMARALGFPTRVAVGFLPGIPNGDGTYTVSTAQAHAWPEVFFPSYGWVAFEPTPSRENPVADAYVNPPPYQQANCKSCAGSRSQGRTTTSTGGLPHRNVGRQLNTTGAIGELPGTSPLRLLERAAGLLLALVLLALMLIPPAKALRRRVPLWRAKASNGRAIASFELFESVAADLGSARGGGETPFAYTSRLAESFPNFPKEKAQRLADTTVRAVYSPRPISADEAELARRDALSGAGFLKSKASFGRRLAGAYRLERFSSRSLPRGMRHSKLE